MKKILIILILPLISLSALQAQITQEAADKIVKEYLGDATIDCMLYAKENFQTDGMTIITFAGEIVEFEYPCWVYYAACSANMNNKYILVNASNGNVLNMNLKGDEMPDDVAQWRILAIDIPFELYSLEGSSCTWSNNITHNDELTIINSSEELELYIDCIENNYNYSEIDFSKYTLLLARGETGGIWDMKINFSRNNENEYILNVVIYLDDSAIWAPWHVSILVRKIDDEATVTLEVQEIDEYE